MEKRLFKVWSAKREKKVAIIVTAERDTVTDVIASAKKKHSLTTEGCKLVLECDGTLIDDDDVLHHFADQTLLILNGDEDWTAPLPTITAEQETITKPSTSSSDVAENIFQLLADSSNMPYDVGVDEAAVETSTKKKIIENYEVPWEAFDENTLSVLNSIKDNCTSPASKEESTAKSVVIWKVVDDLRIFDHRIPLKVLAQVATQIVKRFENAFGDRDVGGNVIDKGCHKILRTLQQRNNYLNRGNKSLLTTLQIPLRKQREIASF